jgi:hypothetical protein
MSTLIYKYGGPNADSHHFTSITEDQGIYRISRSNRKGIAVKNRKNGDNVIVISEKPDGNYRASLGPYTGLDPSKKDVWNDPEAGYDRDNIETWIPTKTITIDKADMFDFNGQGTYNDNGRHASKWLDMILSR